MSCFAYFDNCFLIYLCPNIVRDNITSYGCVFRLQSKLIEQKKELAELAKSAGYEATVQEYAEDAGDEGNNISQHPIIIPIP